MNSRNGLSVYGYIRQNFDKKCLIQEIIAAIIQFYINEGGFLYVCGNGEDGKLGIKEFYGRKCVEPTRVQCVDGIIDIAAFSDHTMLVDYEGSVWAVGRGKDGRLGTGYARNVIVPTQINLSYRAVAVSVGEYHSLILIDNGNILSCGGNYYGQLGQGNYKSQSNRKLVKTLRGHKFIQISAGCYHNGALSKKGGLFMWGWDKYGQCGVGKNIGKRNGIHTPKYIRAKVSVIECGYYHSVLITMSNLLYTFGRGGSRSGHCSGSDKYIPTLIDSLKDVKIIRVAAGHSHTLCIDDDFNAWSFGSNSYGQCGHSKYIKEQAIPTQIEYFKTNKIKAKDVAAGAESSCVITQNNECFVFGNNYKHQIGLKERRHYFVPTKLPLSVQKASMGENHSTFISEQHKD